MCRILLVNLKEPDDVRQYIENFALKCRASKEYQGDGFGIAYLDKNGEPQIEKSLNPIWSSSNIIQKVPYTTFVLVHARSAYGEKTIGDIDYNQPFGDKDFLFAFNGYLQGVGLKTEGKIGAQKIFNLLREKGVQSGIIELNENTQYIKSLNFVLVRNKNIYVHNQYGEKEDVDYFDLWMSQSPNRLIVSSEKIDFLEMKSLEGKGGLNLRRLD